MGTDVPMLDNLLSISLIGKSPALMDVISTVKRVAGYDVVVSIFGETGTGKELIARSLHYCGQRASGPFIPVNCGALPDNLFESELFGYEKGAFTGASCNHPGLIEQAEGGTLFLDEIESLSLKGQVALLRFLQDGQYRRLGGKRFYAADVRVVVASNIHLDELRTPENRFRDDLFYRLNVVPVRIPPLRERAEDIPLLANHFLGIYKSRFELPDKLLTAQSSTWLSSWKWPGNVRELENTIQRGVLLSPSYLIEPQHLMPSAATVDSAEMAGNTAPHKMDFGKARSKVVEAFERDYLHTALLRDAGNVTLSAQQANKDRRSFTRLLKKHGINPSRYRNNVDDQDN